jgi:hypothetical protein
MFKIGSKDTDFYDMFVETADKTCEAAQMLNDLMTNFSGIDAKINAIEEAEHTCDGYVHKILKQLNSTFITPIDREDIYLIAKELDNITDAIESTAHRFKMFGVKSITEDAVKLGGLIIECTRELKNVMVELKNMNKSSALNQKVIEVNRLEDEGDTIFRNAVTNLFLNEKDAIKVIVWKEIYELLENTLDACEDVANIVEGVVMKHT